MDTFQFTGPWEGDPRFESILCLDAVTECHFDESSVLRDVRKVRRFSSHLLRANAFLGRSLSAIIHVSVVLLGCKRQQVDHIVQSLSGLPRVSRFPHRKHWPMGLRYFPRVACPQVCAAAGGCKTGWLHVGVFDVRHCSCWSTVIQLFVCSRTLSIPAMEYFHRYSVTASLIGNYACLASNV